ncbi:MAG: imidazole glycerol phosphate synthase subunit HisH [Moraxella sp.]|nr:imidazole glycerol phosphate synthase subunit HisH [Moraxella sp.]
MTKVALLDYGMGNLHSVAKALSVAGADVVITHDPKVVASADKILFPGVGAMRDCMAGIRETGTDDMLKQAVFNKPVMAICVGMQALFKRSAENGGVDCLGLLDGVVNRFDDSWTDGDQPIKIPHMGWNTIHGMDGSHPLWQGVKPTDFVYFVHSYYCEPQDKAIVAATCDYGTPFCASIIKDNLFATQFHPEKSHSTGLRILKNFVTWGV